MNGGVQPGAPFLHSRAAAPIRYGMEAGETLLR
jgi:hypothetical protein